MTYSKLILTTLVCTFLVGAQGGMNDDDNGMRSDTGITGDREMNQQNKQMKDSTIIGTIDTVNTTDSMFILSSEMTTDTIYFNEETEMKAVKNKFKKDEMVKVRITTQDNRKMATKITPYSTRNKGTKQNKDMKNPDTSGLGTDTGASQY
jgi:hypothetical protein